MMDRPKMGFGIPISIWFRSELRDYFEHYLSKEKLEEHSLLDPAYVSEVKARFYKGEDYRITELWYILMFQMWYEKWMNIATPASS